MKALLVIVLLLALAVPAAAQAFSLVPCGQSNSQGKIDNPCDFRDLIVLVVRMINYLITAAAVVAMYHVVNSAFGMVISMGNPEKIKGAREGVSHAIIGFAIVVLAFVFVNLLVNGVFGISGNTSYTKKWWSVDCLYNITANNCATLK